MQFVKIMSYIAGFWDTGLCKLTDSLGRYYAAGSVRGATGRAFRSTLGISQCRLSTPIQMYDTRRE